MALLASGVRWFAPLGCLLLCSAATLHAQQRAGQPTKDPPPKRQPAKERPAKEQAAKEQPANEQATAEQPAEEQPPAKQRAAPAASGVKLNARQTALLKNELLPAYQAGNAAVLVRLIGELVARQSEAQTTALNAALAEQQAPSLGKMLTDARMTLARLGDTTAPEIKLPELVLLLAEIERQATGLVAEARQLRLMNDPLPEPANLTEFRDLLWDAHVQNNQLINAALLAKQGTELARSPLIAKVKNPTAQQQAAFGIDFAALAAQISSLQTELNERSIELRVSRVAFAEEVLDKERDLKQRFLAAYAAGVDGELLLAGLADEQGPYKRGVFQREKLRSPTLPTELREQVDHAKALAGDLIKKSELLFVGLHWWRRGRYGRGTEGNGLLKPAEALRKLQAQLALFMPRVSPVPTDPLKGGRPTPQYDRRHHWTWAWEDRKFTSSPTGSSSSQSSTTSQSSVNLSGKHFDGWVDGHFY